MRRRPGREMIYAANLSRVDRSFLRALNSARSVLDIGAGNGRFALAASTGRSVVAVDISTEAFTAMRDLATGHDGPTLCQASALHLPFGSCTFDAVVSLDLVEHLHPDPLDPHWDEVYRVLVPGGRYLLHAPSSLHGSTSLGLHLREYRLRELGRAASQAGFQPRWLCLSLARFGWVWTVPAWLWPAVTVWEAIWNVVGSAGRCQGGGGGGGGGVPGGGVDLVETR